jgi:hypothetical protein
VLVTNTGASTLTVNGSSVFGPIAIRRATGVALAAADLNSGGIAEFIYDGTNFQMVNYLGAAATTSTITNIFIPYVADTGAVNALIGTYAPAITSGQQVAGLFLSIKLANTITGACTINVSGLGLKNILTGDLANPPNSVYVAGETLLLCYDGTQYQIVNSNSLIYRKPAANVQLFVNGAIGNDANDGVSNTSGHALATIGGGVLKAFSYAPSQFTITITVEPGTYNEAVATPSYAGPNIIIDGLVASSVVVNSAGGNAFVAQGPNTLTVKNLTVQALVYGFFAISGASLTTLNTVSNSCATVFAAAFNGTLVAGVHTFSGSGSSLYYAFNDGSMTLSTIAHTISTPISVSLATAVAAFGGIITGNTVSPLTFVNPSFVSGAKFNCQYNGTINTTALGPNYFPGSVGGSVSFGGQIAT